MACAGSVVSSSSNGSGVLSKLSRGDDDDPMLLVLVILVALSARLPFLDIRRRRSDLDDLGESVGTPGPASIPSVLMRDGFAALLVPSDDDAAVEVVVLLVVEVEGPPNAAIKSKSSVAPLSLLVVVVVVVDVVVPVPKSMASNGLVRLAMLDSIARVWFASMSLCRGCSWWTFYRKSKMWGEFGFGPVTVE